MVDLRHPLASVDPKEWNPFLRDEKCALRVTSRDIIAVFEQKGCHLPVLIGSSGVGKTTTAFLVCEQMHCIFLELIAARTAHKCGGIFLGYWVFLEKDASAIENLVLREVGRRALIFAHLWQKTGGSLTPYEWFLFQLGKDFCDVVGRLEMVSFAPSVWWDVIQEASQLVGGKLAVILDGAHLINTSDKMDVKGDGVMLTTFQVVLNVLSGTGIVECFRWAGSPKRTVFRRWWQSLTRWVPLPM